MENSYTFWDFGPYGPYIYASVGLTFMIMGILLWRSLRQLSQQKKALQKSQNTHEA